MLQQAPLLHQVAQGMLERALAESAAQFELQDAAQLIAKMRRGDCYDCDTVRFNLGRQVAAYLATTDPNLRAVYWYDPECAPGTYAQERNGPSASSAINLLAWTGLKTRTLFNTLAELREALLDARADLLCPQAEGLCYNLDVVVVDDVEVSARRGYAALLDAVWARPALVWSRQST
jgi:hypothetical protein